VQELPAVAQFGLSGVHVPAPPSGIVQLPLQQLVLDVHAWLSDVQIVLPHRPPLQTKVQHSLLVVQL
jgi:hypothetical protein